MKTVAREMSSLIHERKGGRFQVCIVVVISSHSPHGARKRDKAGRKKRFENVPAGQLKEMLPE